MRRIGNIVSLPLVLLLFPLILFSLVEDSQAQDFQLEATVSENQVFVGEQFTISVEVAGSSMRNVSLPVLPELEGMRVLSSTPSRSTSISIVNGQTTTTTTYNFSVIARETGEYTIPPISIEIDGEERQTNPIRVEVIEQGRSSQDGSRQRPEIYLEVQVDESNPVPGQQIVASVVLFFRQGIEVTSFQPTAGWRTDGFWKEELQNIRQPQAESVIIDGVRYRSATLMRYALFPNRSGELTLSGFPINVGIRTQASRNDPFGSFFGSSSNQRRVSLESEPVVLNVSPLPEASNATMMNAVGDLRVERSLSKSEVVTGETIELITKVEGVGNIPLVRRPQYSMPDGIELFTPQENSNVERRGLAIRGDKTFTELLAPRAPGTYRIPAERIAVFNPQNRRYRYVDLPAIEFEALPAVNNQFTAADLRTVQLKPVTGLAVWTNSEPAGSVFRSFWFWLLVLIPVAALIAAHHKRKFDLRLHSDRQFARVHYAEQLVQDRFTYARSIVNEDKPKEIYNTLHKAVFGYLTDKLSLPEAGLSDQELLEKVKEHGVNADLMKRLRNILDKCATISYAPSGTREDFRSDIIKTEKLISELKEQL